MRQKKTRNVFFGSKKRPNEEREKRNGGERREDRDAKERGRAPLRARVEPRAFEALLTAKGRNAKDAIETLRSSVGTTIDCASSIIF
jgi:hypothetical protein